MNAATKAATPPTTDAKRDNEATIAAVRVAPEKKCVNLSGFVEG
jgi:hypothetical protein